MSASSRLTRAHSIFTVLAKMEEASAASAVKGFAPVLNRIEAQTRLSMTYDQGREMAGHSNWQRKPTSMYALLTRTALGSEVATRIPAA